jgi:hypothetical protein
MVSIDIYTLITSLSLLVVCFFCSMFILFHLGSRQHKRKNVRIQIQRPLSATSIDSVSSAESWYSSTVATMTHREMFVRLTHFSITFMIASDFVFTILYTLTNIMRLLLIVVDMTGDVKIPLAHVSNTMAEISEMFIVSSCMWSLFASLNIYLTIRTIHTHHEHSTIGTTETQQESSYETMSRYKKLFFVSANIIPLIFCVVWLAIAEAVPAYSRKGLIVYVAEIVPDIIRTLGYIILEIFAIVIRILVYASTKRIISSAHFNKSSAAAMKRDQKLRTLVRQLTAYTMPFVFFGIWIIIMRTYLDSWYTVLVIKKGVENFTTYDISFTGHILTGLQRIFTPMKVLMNVVVYGVMTKWFQKRFMNMCCGSPEDKEEEVRPLVT